MREKEERRNLSTLPVELKVKLNFREDPQEPGWLIHDSFGEVGNIELYEWLPTKTRVSSDGSRYELGVDREDLEGLLALWRLSKPNVQDVDKIISFWENHPQLDAHQEGEMVFLGVDIEPTPAGFEKKYSTLMQGYNTAITGAIENLTYQQMMKIKKYRDHIKYFETVDQQTMLFSSLCEYMDVNVAKTEVVEEDKEQISADTLTELPIVDNKFFLYFAPFTLIEDDKRREGADVMLSSRTNDGERTINLWKAFGFGIDIFVPQGVEIETVRDLQKLTQARLLDKDQKTKANLQVSITVKDDFFRITSNDRKFVLEVRKPKCEGCDIPIWKFPWPEGEPSSLNLPSVASVSSGYFLHNVNTSLGIYRCLVQAEAGEKTYCSDCIDPLEQEYIDIHPFVSEARATEVVRRRLDEMHYEEASIDNKEGWNFRKGRGWEFFAKIEYQRNGKRILRYVGRPYLSDEGEFTPNMLSHEHVNFRY